MDSDALQVVRNDRFAKFIGAEIVKAEPGYAVVEMKITDNHMNGLNMVQGGAIFTLADYAFAAASNNSGNITIGVNVNISYLKSKGFVFNSCCQGSELGQESDSLQCGGYR